MASKLIAARLATAAGCGVAHRPRRRRWRRSRRSRPAPAPRCFPAATSARRARKEWLAASLGVVGALVIDEGAVAALKRG